MTTPVTTPIQETTSHVTSHDSFQQPLYSGGSGQILSQDPPSQVEMETKDILPFHDHMELPADMCQHWNNLSHVCPHAVPFPLLQSSLINPVQESCGQSDTRNTSQTVPVNNEEHFVISQVNCT